jgi:hypothetical protein
MPLPTFREPDSTKMLDATISNSNRHAATAAT